jgi:hypothetical protein
VPRELQKDVEASSKIARIGAVFGQHREVFLELSTSADVQLQGGKVNCCVWLAIWGPLGCGILEAVKGASGYSDSLAACLRVDFDGPVWVTLWSHVARKNDVCFISAYAELQRKTKMLKAAALIFGTSSFSMRGFAPHSFCTHGLKVALLTEFPRLLGFHLWSLALFVAPVTPVTLYLLKTGMIF